MKKMFEGIFRKINRHKSSIDSETFCTDIRFILHISTNKTKRCAWIYVTDFLHNCNTSIYYWTGFVQSSHQAIFCRAISMSFQMKFYGIKITLIDLHPNPITLMRF